MQTAKNRPRPWLLAILTLLMGGGLLTCTRPPPPTRPRPTPRLAPCPTGQSAVGAAQGLICQLGRSRFDAAYGLLSAGARREWKTSRVWLLSLLEQSEALGGLKVAPLPACAATPFEGCEVLAYFPAQEEIMAFVIMRDKGQFRVDQRLRWRLGKPQTRGAIGGLTPILPLNERGGVAQAESGLMMLFGVTRKDSDHLRLISDVTATPLHSSKVSYLKPTAQDVEDLPEGYEAARCVLLRSSLREGPAVKGEKGEFDTIDHLLCWNGKRLHPYSAPTEGER